MARQVYASFHYADIWRANVVRKSSTVRAAGTEVGFYDHSLWEKAKTKGDAAIKRLIDEGMVGAGVTMVLVGSETYMRPWVLYEIEKSHADGMGVVAVHINSIRGQDQLTKSIGPNPLDYVSVPQGVWGKQPLSALYRTYDWVSDNGYANAGSWIDEAARAAGR
jgi:hypothetical protein